MTAAGTPRTIDSLELLGYRGFSTRQQVTFAAPNGKPGSGLTVFVGANNAGKSSVVEALRKFVLPDVSFPEGQRNKKARDRVSLKLTGADRNERVINTVDAGGSETVPLHGTLRYASDLLVVPSR